MMPAKHEPIDLQIAAIMERREAVRKAEEAARRVREEAERAACEEQRRNAERERLHGAITRLPSLRREYDAAHKQRISAQVELEGLLASETYTRWLRAPWVANAAGCGHSWSVYGAWVASGRPDQRGLRRPDEYPAEGWPLSIVFDSEREVILSVRKLEEDLAHLKQREDGLQSQIEAILSEFPELE